MDYRVAINVFAVWMLMMMVVPSISFGQEKMEGTVLKTNLTACGVVPGKVGTCEGTLVLESKKDGKPQQTTVKVTRDTALKKGDEKVFLFQLQGAPVTVSFFEGKGEKVAQSVVTKAR